MKFSVLSKIAIGLFVFLGFISCGEEEAPAVSSEEQIVQYLAANNITAQRTSTGLYYVIEEPGVDPKPTRSSTVTIDYRGFLFNGDVFDSSYDRGQPLVISLRQVIPGWTEGIPLFGSGGKGKLFIPYELAYGTNGTSNGSIPPNTSIGFDIELFSFQ